jgi:hypothetical protein
MIGGFPRGSLSGHQPINTLLFFLKSLFVNKAEMEEITVTAIVDRRSMVIDA